MSCVQLWWMGWDIPASCSPVRIFVVFGSAVCVDRLPTILVSCCSDIGRQSLLFVQDIKQRQNVVRKAN